MENKLVLFDNAERTRELVLRLYLTGDRELIVPENFKELKKVLSKGYSPSVTEFSLVNLRSEEIRPFLDCLVRSETPTVVYTNTQMYKEYLGQLKKANIYAIIRKIPVRGDNALKNSIEHLLSGKPSDGMQIIDADCKPSSGIVTDGYNIRKGNHPHYTDRVFFNSRDD